MKKFVIGFIVVLVIATIAIQMMPVDRTNPPVRMDMPAPIEVKAILKRACYDCHSNEVNWPDYGKVAPVAWLIEHDIEEGRRHLNFSEWDKYPKSEYTHIYYSMLKEIEKGTMPPEEYITMHPEAKLSQEDIETIANWANSEGAGYVLGSYSKEDK